MENLLHYVWRHKLYASESLFTSTGESVFVIDSGILNTNAGPDFFNAKIKIGDKIWAGNVEIHISSSDWIKHGHHTDKAYDSVILHIVEKIDCETYTTDGIAIPQVSIKIPENVHSHYEYLLSRDEKIPCLNSIHDIPKIYLSDWLNYLLMERLERKTNDLLHLLDKYAGDWGEVFYITLSRNFGFGINNDAFERLAKSLPLKYIAKYKDSSLQIEALFFGQAGLLEEELDDEYYSALQKEYQFMQHKFKLKPLESHIFKNLRVRPINFPHIKIAQLAELIRTQDYLFSRILESEDIDTLRRLLIPELKSYWQTHYMFGKTSPKNNKKIGLSAQNIILINTISPLLFAYGKAKNLPRFQERAVQLIESIKPESNNIVNTFEKNGIIPIHAGDSQALIQLQKEYCEKKKCIYCRIGHKLLAK